MTDVSLKQTARTLVMIRPASFGFNEETAGTNLFQSRPGETDTAAVSNLAVAEFDALVDTIRNAGSEVIVVRDRPESLTTDAVFPNNWISFHSDGTVVLYPMHAPSRRPERRDDIVPMLKANHGFDVTRIVDLGHHEREGRYLEGTGSIVFDHMNRSAYACLSARTDAALVDELAKILGYEPVVFHASDREGNDVYHTNVVMSIGNEFAVVATEAIPGSKERRRVVESLEATGRHLVRIDLDQMTRFGSNILEVEGREGDRVLVMSTSARDAFKPEQLAILEDSARIVASPLPTIEAVGGGSARCMLAEVFLTRKVGDAL